MADPADQKRPDLRPLRDRAREVRRRIGSVVFGQDDTIDLMLVALGADGHVLIEGLPGVGKTTLAKTFAHVVGLDFGRIQLTPDLMPADITGHTYYDQSAQEFKIRKGPVFTNLLLADELNRTPPRTQAALLEVMQERQVTIEGNTIPAPDPFLVLATKNPIEIEGVYALPEAELDRFMVYVRLGYPSRDAEAAMLDAKMRPANGLPEPVPEFPRALRRAVNHIHVDADVRDYLLDIVRRTREHPFVQFGASPRSSEHLLRAARAHAALRGRWYVIPDDVKRLVHPVLVHRILLTADAEVQETTAADVLDEVLDTVEVPVVPRAEEDAVPVGTGEP